MNSHWPRAVVTVQLIAASTLASLGVGLLVFAITRSRTPDPEKVRATAERTRDLKREWNDIEDKVRQAKADADATEAALSAKRNDLERRKRSLEDRRARVQMAEAESKEKAADQQQEIEEARRKAQEELDQANRVLHEKEQRQAQQRLDEERAKDYIKQYESTLVTVLTVGGKIGSGFFYTPDPKSSYIVTLADNVSEKEVVALKIRVRSNTGNRYVAALFEGRLLWRDPKTGLALLRFSTGLYRGSFRITNINSDALGEGKKGDRVYTVGTQVLGDELLEFTAFDGEIGMEGRQVNDLTVMQATLPANPGTQGSPVFTADGQVLGILMSPATGLEKVSFVIPSSAIQKTIDHWKDAGAVDPGPKQEGVAPPPMRVQVPIRVPASQHNKELKEAAQKRELSYDAKCVVPMSKPQDVYPSVEDKFVVYDEKARGLVCYSCRKPFAPAWEHKANWSDIIWGFEDGTALARPYREGISALNARNILEQIDFRTGKVGKRWTPAKSFGFWPGSGRVWQNILVRDRVLHVFDLQSGSELMWSGCDLLGMVNGRLVYVKEGKLGAINVSAVQPFLERVKQLDNQGKGNPKLLAQLHEAKTKLANDFADNLPTSNDSLPQADRHQRNFGIISTGRILAGHTLIGTQPKVEGTLEFVKHSAATEPWFQYYLSSASNEGKILGVSPDGSLALSRTHLISLKTFKPVAELPIPLELGVITLDGSCVVFYDKLHERVAFWTVSELLKAGMPKE